MLVRFVGLTVPVLSAALLAVLSARRADRARRRIRLFGHLGFVHNGDRILACGCGLVVAAGFVLIEEQHCLAPFLASTAGGKPSGGMRSDDTAEHGKTEISA